MKGSAILLTVSLLAQLSLSGAIRSGSFDATRFFSFNASSTCGEDSGSGSGSMPGCMLEERNAMFALDGDLSTWWQSDDGDTPVMMTFSLQSRHISLDVVGLQLVFLDSLPLSLSVEAQPLSSDQFLFLHQYTADGSCDLNATTCSDLSSVTTETTSNITTLEIPLTANEPVGVVRLVASGFEFGLPPEDQHYSLAEARVFTVIASGYFVPSLHSIQVSGREGMFTPSGEPVPIGVDHALFSRSRGHAVLNISDEELVNVQFVIPSIPRAGRYRIVFRFDQVGLSRRRMILVQQGGTSVSGRVSFHVNCDPPCYEPLVSSQDISQVAVVDLVEGPVSVLISLTGINVLIDAIIVIPEEYYTADIPEGVEFSRDCDVTTAMFSSELCVRGATQLSLSYHRLLAVTTPPCECGGVGSVVGAVCESYGGQCPCVQPDAGFSKFIGRQCDLCPTYSYLTAQGCTECECPDPLDMCDMVTGQCVSCPPLVVGRSCDSCIDNSFGNPAVGCEPCMCDLTGTEVCNSTSGECVCRSGVGGALCDRCVEGAFNFSSDGCEACGCDSVGSVGVSCEETGQCSCKTGVGGLKCSECLPTYFALSPAGCLPCNCSGRTSSCATPPGFNGSDPTEMCDCPYPYTGASCEGCVEGFFLSAVTGNCESCQCNGRAENCAAGNGECIDCRANTTGSNCEVCSEGFYSNDPGGDLRCLECPCDSIRVSNSSCFVNPSGNVSCHCLPGHVGPFCDVCDSGYYGAPPNFRCTSCECNGNIDPDTPMSCDRNTGVCLVCINNSTGDECQFCADGFYGNATTQDCRPCRCEGAGSVSAICDRTTGQCPCLSGVGERVCDQCESGYWNFTAGVGCEACDCSDGSVSQNCNAVTGQCPCRPGVGGASCTSCRDGFYNFTTEGCSACGCGLGAIDTSCSSDGRCACRPGVTGVKCDMCASFHTNLTTSGCVPCGECEQMIRDQVGVVNGDLVQAEGALNLLEGLYTADQRGCGQINESLAVMNDTVAMTTEGIDRVESRIDSLDNDRERIQIIVNDNLAEIQAALARVERLLPYAESVHEHIQTVYNMMQDVLIDIGAVNTIVRPIISMLDQRVARSEVVSMEIVNISGMHNEDYSSVVTDASVLLADVTAIRNMLSLYLSYSQNQLQQAVNISIKYQGVESQNDELTNQIAALQNRLNDTTSMFNAVSAALQQLEGDVAMVNGVVTFANGTLESADSAVSDARIALMRIQNFIQEFGDLVGEEATNNNFMSGSGSGSGMGSGMNLIEPSTSASPETTPTTIRMGVAVLEERVNVLSREIADCEQALLAAEDHVTSLRMAAQRINNTLSPSLFAGNSAVSAIIDYMETLRLIEEAVNLTAVINSTLQQAHSITTSLDAESLESRAALLLQNAQLLLSQAEAVRGGVANLTLLYQSTKVIVERDTNVTARLDRESRLLRARVSSLSVGVSGFRGMVDRALEGVNRTLGQVEEDEGYVMQTVSRLQADAASSVGLVEQAENLINETDALIASTDSSLMETRDHVNQSVQLLSAIQTQADVNEEQLARLSSSVDSINRQLEEALRAAEMIDIALNFNGDTQHSYPAPPPLSVNTTTTISLAFRPSQVEYGTLLQSGMGSADLGMGPDQPGAVSLRLFNGSVQFGYDGSDSVSTEGGVVRVDEWYQVYASRDSDHAYLSVAPLQGGFPTYSTVTMTSQLTAPSITVNDVIMLGGGVADVGPVTPNTEGFTGCIDRVVVNNNQLSLLLPSTGLANDVIPSVCDIRPPADIPRTFETGAWLQGGRSFIRLTPPSLAIEQSIRVSMSFRTLSQSGTILYLTSQSLVEYITVFLMNGRLVLEYSQTGMDSSRVSTLGVYSSGQWYGLGLVISQQGGTLTINGTEVVTMGTPTIMSGAFNLTNQLFVGGVSPEVEGIVDTGRPSLPGCVRGVVVNDEQLDLNQSVSSHVVLGGCPEQVSAGVRFMGDGYAEFTLMGAELLDEVGVEFRTTQLAASLLELNSVPPVSISLYHTRVRVDVAGFNWVSMVTDLNENRWHTVTLSLTNSTLTLDGEVYPLGQLSFQARPPSTLSVGGSPDLPNTALPVVTESFRGCVRNIRVNTRIMDFNSADTLVGVALYGCRPPSVTVPTPPPPPPLPPPPSTRPNVTVGLDGGDGSFIAIRLAPEEVLLSYSIIVEFRTSSSEALLLYSQDIAAMFADFLSLELMGGRLVYSYNLGGGRVSISSNHTYHDGQLHTTEIRRVSRMGELIIDEGAEYLTGVSPGIYEHLNIYSGLLYVGGVPNILNISLTRPGEEDPHSAQACFHALSINSIYENISSAQATNGASLTCLESYSNLATFGTDSYLRILDDFDGGTSFSFSLRFRTLSCTGLLLYSHSLLYPDYFLLELVNNTVRFIFDNGPRETLVEYIPTSSALLCDNEWHTLLIEKDGVRGVVSVDGGDPVTAVSPHASFRAVNLNDPLYIGGTPAILRKRSSSLAGSFEGCIGDVYVTQEIRRGLLLAQALGGENTVFNTCTL